MTDLKIKNETEYETYEAPNPTVKPSDFEHRFTGTEEKLTQTQYDFIIIGSGSAGCALVNRLCNERPDFKILLLEAGGEAHNSKVVKDPQKFTQLWNTMIDWQFTMEPMKGLRNRNSDTPKQVMAERGKTTGGTSTINAMMWVRASKEDCDRWENAGAKGWEYSNVLKNAKAIEAVQDYEELPSELRSNRGQNGPIEVHKVKYTKLDDAFSKACAKQGFVETIDYNAEMAIGNKETSAKGIIAQAQFNAGATSGRQDAFSKFIEPIMQPQFGRPKLYIASSTFVRKILFEKRNEEPYPRAIAVEVELNNGTILKIPARREIILSAGAVGSPHLLLLSGIGDREHLNEFGIKCISHAPGVGREMQDHAGCGIGFSFNDDVDLSPKYINSQAMFGFLQTKTAKELEEKDGQPRGMDIQFMLDARGLSNTARRNIPPLLFRPENRGELMQHLKEQYLYQFKLWDEERAKWGTGREKRNGGIGVILNQCVSRGRVQLRSGDPHIGPKIDPGQLTDKDEIDLKALADGMREIWKIVNTEPFKSYIDWNSGTSLSNIDINNDDQLHQYLRMATGSAWHYSSTCKMGVAEDPLAVLDSKLRVRGVIGLRVVDASVMPQGKKYPHIHTHIYIHTYIYLYIQEGNI